MRSAPNKPLQATAKSAPRLSTTTFSETGVGMDWKVFENRARQQMPKHLGVTLVERRLPGFPKKFDMVSEDGSTVGHGA
jgi:hypothetical protein